MMTDGGMTKRCYGCVGILPWCDLIEDGGENDRSKRAGTLGVVRRILNTVGEPRNAATG